MTSTTVKHYRKLPKTPKSIETIDLCLYGLTLFNAGLLFGCIIMALAT